MSLIRGTHSLAGFASHPFPFQMTDVTEWSEQQGAQAARETGRPSQVRANGQEMEVWEVSPKSRVGRGLHPAEAERKGGQEGTQQAGD